MSLATALVKQTTSWMSSNWAFVMGLLQGVLIGLALVFLVTPLKLPYVLYLNDAGCVVAKEAGLNPATVQEGICSIQGKAELHDHSIVISGVFLDRAYVIAGKKISD